jgi:hypothetical protein
MESQGVHIETELITIKDGEEKEKRTFQFPEEQKGQMATIVMNNQRRSLDKWVDYLSSDADAYPMWAKYWAFQSMITMGKLVKQEDGQGGIQAKFQKRDKKTVASFPPLNQRALAKTFGVMSGQLEYKEKRKNARQEDEESNKPKNESTKLNDEAFQKLLSTENFAKLYAQFLVELPEYSTEGLQETRGEWITYPRGSNATKLVESMDGYPLEWCTSEYDTANIQLKGGDLHIYYSVNEDGDATVPRLAIRMEGNKIAEPPRGIAPGQNLDPYIAPVLEAKLKRLADRQYLTEIEAKIQKGTNPIKEDLLFLYEVDRPIEGFGYEPDTHILELRGQRNLEQDMPIVFDCEPTDIAHTPDDITENTKAYVGSLAPGIFQKLPDSCEHIYTSFPERKIRRTQIEIGGKTATELETEMTQAGIQIAPYANDMLHSTAFETKSKSEEADLVRLSVADLGFSNGTTIEEVYAKAKELGLSLCSAEVGPRYRLSYKDQPMNELEYIGMEQIAVSVGYPFVFHVSHDDNGLWLGGRWASPGFRWYPLHGFVFRLLKSFES